MSFHQQIKTDMRKIMDCTASDQQIFKDFLRTNYSFLWNYGDIYDFYFLSLITFRDNTTEYDLKLHLRYRNRIWNKETD